jgi:hypothetical protein
VFSLKFYPMSVSELVRVDLVAIVELVDCRHNLHDVVVRCMVLNEH